MPELHTARLRLIPLDLESLRLCLMDKAAMERRLGLASGGAFPGEMRPIYEIKIGKMAAVPESWLFCTYWQIVLQGENRIIGEVGFKGAPDERGRIEVGYGLEEAYRGKGYMTEALAVLMEWAFAQPGVRAVIASTDKDNLPSQRVLERAGMRREGEDGEHYWWMREKLE